MKFLRNIRNSALTMSITSVAMMPTAFADDTNTLGNNVINAVLNVVFNMSMWIGIILLAWSVVMLVLALKNEDADSKSRAIMLIAVSIALIGIKPVVSGILNVAGFEVAGGDD